MSFLLSEPGAGTPFSGVTTDGLTILGDGLNIPLYAVTNPTGKGLITGGAIWSGTGFTFDVSDLTYYIDGTNYSSTATQVTLSASDPSDDRFDVIVVDDTGTVSVVTGTPGTPPNVPELAWNEVAVTIVLVESGSTTPAINYDLVYNENLGTPTEWAAATYSLSSPLGTVVSNSGASPFNGTVCVRASGVNNRRGVVFTRATDINIQQFSSLQFAVRLDTTVTTAQNFNVRFRNSGGTLIGNTVNVFNWGVSRTVAGTWQVVVIPLTAFGNITNVRGLIGIMQGGTVGTTYNWSMDFVKLADSIPPQQNLGPIYLSATGTLYSSGAANGATGVDSSIFFGTLAGFQATAADNSIFLGNKAGYKAAYALSSVFFGKETGYAATYSAYSVFLGEQAGYKADGAQQSNFIGYRAGYNDTFGPSFQPVRSNFFGYEAGFDAGNASDSGFFGYKAGQKATNAAYSDFFGTQAGYEATNANNSFFFGYQAGYQAAGAANSIFIGYRSGYLDTVDNTVSGASVLVGNNTSTGGFKNSIAIGDSATNTAVNQFMIGSGTTPINEVVIIGTGGIQVPVGTTGERIATQGMIRYNTTTSKFEGYDGTTWQNFY